MSYLWTDSERRFQADVDDMVQDIAIAEFERLAGALEVGSLTLDGEPERVAAELRARARERILFRPVSLGLAGQGVAVADDRFPW